MGRRLDVPGRALRQEALANGDPGGLVRSMPRFAALGPVFKSSAPASLTEEETEYSISAVKHVFARHLLLQFTCTNTVAEQVLENVSVTVDLGQAVRPRSSAAPELPPALQGPARPAARSHLLLDLRRRCLAARRRRASLHCLVKRDPAKDAAPAPRCRVGRPRARGRGARLWLRPGAAPAPAALGQQCAPWCRVALQGSGQQCWKKRCARRPWGCADREAPARARAAGGV